MNISFFSPPNLEWGICGAGSPQIHPDKILHEAGWKNKTEILCSTLTGKSMGRPDHPTLDPAPRETREGPLGWELGESRILEKSVDWRAVIYW